MRGITMGGVMGGRRFDLAIAVVGMLSMFALAFGMTSQAQAGKKSSKPVVKIKIKTSTQAALAKGKVKVTAKARKPKKQKKQRVKLYAKLKVGNKTIKNAGKAGTRFKRGKQKTVRIKLSKKAKKLATTCGKPKLTVISKTKVKKTYRKHGRKKHKTSWKKSGKTRRTLKQDESNCPPEGPKVVPVPDTIDLASADRCDFITQGTAPDTECLFPYPNDYFTKADSTTKTGLRLNLNEQSTPANAGTPTVPPKHIDPKDINLSDGFSPGAPIITQVPGLDTLQAFQATGMVGIHKKSNYSAADQPLVMIDAATGQREPIWAELDANASSPEQTDLEIHFNKNLIEGHRYIVAMRNLKRADGSTIEAPDGFKLYRTENEVTENPVIESRRAGFEDIFAKLGTAGIARDSLYMAWDFTVASTENITERMLHIRDDAFAQLGDNNLADGIQQGVAPTFSINPNDGDDNVNGRNGTIDYPLTPVPVTGNGVENIRTINGTVTVPCYLDIAGVPDPLGNGCPAGSKFKLDAQGMPIRTPGATMTAPFTCNIPRSAAQDDGGGDLDVTSPVRTSLYGHGLFGDYTEGNTGDVRKLGNDHGVMVCATDWSGMADDDVYPSAIPALSDMSKFSTIPDRLQQGFLNFLYLGRLMKTTAAQGGFAGNPAFQDDSGDSFIKTNDLSYYGNSQGGIAGGALTAIAPDLTRSVLYVPGMRYSELLPRSVDFDDYATILYPSYPIERTRPLLLTMIQGMWDRGEPNGYANHMTDNPLPNTPAHKVLIEMAYGDHQVSNITAEAEARTIGAPLRQPAVAADRLQPGLIEPWFDSGPLGDLSGPAKNGSGAFVWDIGPKRMVGNQMFGTNPNPLTNTTSPTTDITNSVNPGFDSDQGYGIDPHDTVIRQTPEVREQIAKFMEENGVITDPCGVDPCYAAGWTGAP
ncbi:MAG: hypothetical protein IPK93_11705 [Solirubrobacterales bacterium]|nr:hypothetical protein [Solirubrobacterales bacterium]